MADYVFTVQDLKKSYAGGKEIFNGITLSFLPDAKIGVVGHNGAGKSTFLKIMAGLDKEFSGEAFAKKGINIGYLPQEPKLNEKLTVKENVLEALKDVQNLLKEFNEVSSKFAEEMTDDEMNALLEKQAELQTQIEAKDGWNIEHKVEMAMEALRCPDGDKEITSLSGGEKRRIALCKILLEAPEIILLDEPTNHLDTESVAWLEKHLKEYKGMVMIVTHDRYFLDNITNWILEIDKGQGIPYKGNYSDWVLQKQKRVEMDEKEQKYKSRILAVELEWIRKSPKARQAKSKARIQAYDELLKSNEKQENYSGSMVISEPKNRLGDLVINAENISKSFDDKLLFENLSFNIPKGAIVGVVGANGAGKSTLFKLITGKESVDKGNLKVGETVEFGFVDQDRDSLNDQNTVWEEISDKNELINIGSREIQSRSYVAQFGFKGSEQQKKVAQLSGGERNRVHMAKVMKKQSNVILLDEPTNDLDVETLQALENAILNFSGCVLVISHDRWFLDRIATHIIGFEGDSNVVFIEGNYREYEDDKKKRLGVSEIIPKRIQYRKLKL